MQILAAEFNQVRIRPLRFVIRTSHGTRHYALLRSPPRRCRPLGAGGRGGWRDILNERHRRTSDHVVPRIGVGQGRCCVRVSCVRIAAACVFFFPPVYALVTDKTGWKRGQVADRDEGREGKKHAVRKIPARVWGRPSNTHQRSEQK